MNAFKAYTVRLEILSGLSSVKYIKRGYSATYKLLEGIKISEMQLNYGRSWQVREAVLTLVNVKDRLQFQLNFCPTWIPIFNVIDLQIVLILAPKS